MLLLAQALGEKYVSMLEKAYEGDIDVLTGSEIGENEKRHVYATRRYNPDSFVSRIHSWLVYYRDVKRIVKREKMKPDVIFAISNPPINSILAYRLKKKFRCKVIFMDWDIYPELIERTFDNVLIRLLCKMWHRINDYILPRIDLILTIGNYMRQSIEEGIKHPIKIEVVSLFTDCTRLRPIEKPNNEFCKQLNLADKVIFMYSGKMGIGHDLDIIIDAAKVLEHETDIHFLLIGEGQRYKMVENRIIQEKIKNVTLLPFQPEKIFPQSLACGDVALVTQEGSLANLFLPSKSYDMMAVGMPIIGICTEKDDLADLIRGNSVGEIVTDGKCETLIKKILFFANHHDIRYEYSKTARKVAIEKYDEKVVVNQYKRIFGEIENL